MRPTSTLKHLDYTPIRACVVCEYVPPLQQCGRIRPRRSGDAHPHNRPRLARPVLNHSEKTTYNARSIASFKVLRQARPRSGCQCHQSPLVEDATSCRLHGSDRRQPPARRPSQYMDYTSVGSSQWDRFQEGLSLRRPGPRQIRRAKGRRQSKLGTALASFCFSSPYTNKYTTRALQAVQHAA